MALKAYNGREYKNTSEAVQDHLIDADPFNGRLEILELRIRNIIECLGELVQLLEEKGLTHEEEIDDKLLV